MMIGSLNLGVHVTFVCGSKCTPMIMMRLYRSAVGMPEGLTTTALWD
jgi:hypothetical protein